MSFVTVPGRTLNPDEIQRYNDDGVVMIKQAVHANWLGLTKRASKKRAWTFSCWVASCRETRGYQMDTWHGSKRSGRRM